MSLTKKIKDQFIKSFWGNTSVPRGLFEINQYFRHHDPINFKLTDGENGNIIAISTNYTLGSIITSAKTLGELDKNIKDAILTSFEIPSSFAKEVDLNRVNNEQREYALA